MITNISLITLWVTDQDQARDFYVNRLGFERKGDVTMGDGFRWVTIAHPNQPELEVTLMVPGPPLDPKMAQAVERSLAKGRMGGFGLGPTIARRLTKSCRPKASGSSSHRPSGRTASRL